MRRLKTAFLSAGFVLLSFSSQAAQTCDASGHCECPTKANTKLVQVNLLQSQSLAHVICAYQDKSSYTDADHRYVPDVPLNNWHESGVLPGNYQCNTLPCRYRIK